MTEVTKFRTRLMSGEERITTLADVSARHVENILPWRPFRWYRGQMHLPGSYWSARMASPVGYESQLELANLLLMDFDPGIRVIVSQPFHLEGFDGTRLRNRIPDYLIHLYDGRIRVIDVKPSAKLGAAKVRTAFEWTRKVITGLGWEYEVCSEPDVTLIANVRFLSGYRWSDRFERSEVQLARSAVDRPMTFATAVRRATPTAGNDQRARAVVLHLLWGHRLKTDMSRLLDSESEVVPT